MDSTSISLPDFRSAILLNNLSVSFLERQAYPQALDTLKDAICVMKKVLRPEQFADGQWGLRNVDEKVNKAYRLLARTSEERLSQESLVDTITFDNGPMRFAAALPFLWADSPCQTINPIRIEIMDFQGLLDRDTDLDSAIMLYNFALAHLALDSHGPTSQKHKLGALALFDMATTVIMSDNGLYFKNPDEHQQAEGFNENRLVLSFIITANRLRVLEELGEFSAADEISGHLSLLEDAVLELMGSESEYIPSSSSTPAAAA